MKINLINLFILTLFPLHILTAQPQEIEMIDYPTFEARVNEQTDQLVIYNFWATWCGPCVKELPEFERVNEEYADRNVKVVFVSLDFASMKAQVEAFVANKDIQAEVILLNAPDYNAWIDKVSPDWSGAIPATLIVKPSAGIREFKEQSFTYEELTAWVEGIE